MLLRRRHPAERLRLQVRRQLHALQQLAVAAHPDEQLLDVGPLAHQRVHQRRVAAVVRQVDVGLVLDQHLRHLRRLGEVQRRRACRVDAVDVGIPGDEVLHQLEAPLARRDVQRRRAGLGVLEVDVEALALEQDLDQLSELQQAQALGHGVCDELHALGDELRHLEVDGHLQQLHRLVGLPAKAARVNKAHHELEGRAVHVGLDEGVLEGAVLVAVLVEHVPQVLVARRHHDPQPAHVLALRAHDERDIGKIVIAERLHELNSKRRALILH
mmetsp:Transcript_63582/g.170141  ORF Transcript_63582/g.170141 Transcript_63582/m.170141 type:complete len:271 (+) Transcript_63582:896-1708(+)